MDPSALNWDSAVAGGCPWRVREGVQPLPRDVRIWALGPWDVNGSGMRDRSPIDAWPRDLGRRIKIVRETNVAPLFECGSILIFLVFDKLGIAFELLSG